MYMQVENPVLSNEAVHSAIFDAERKKKGLVLLHCSLLPYSGTVLPMSVMPQTAVSVTVLYCRQPCHIYLKGMTRNKLQVTLRHRPWLNGGLVA